MQLEVCPTMQDSVSMKQIGDSFAIPIMFTTVDEVQSLVFKKSEWELHVLSV